MYFSDQQRPNIFINELRLYVTHLQKEIGEFSGSLTTSQIKKWNTFKNNLLDGVKYYHNLFNESDFFKNSP